MCDIVGKPSYSTALLGITHNVLSKTHGIMYMLNT